MTMSDRIGDMVQIHMLTAYPASLLNRDDVGLAKRIPFGGATRTRVSSQCLKKHWRESALIADAGDAAVRSARVYERLVAAPLVSEHGASETEAVAIAKWLMGQTVDTEPVPKKTGIESAQSSQLLVLSKAETGFLYETAVRVLRDLRERGVEISDEQAVGKESQLEDAKALRLVLKALPASIDTSLFGRMVTSDLFARVDAAVSVAHAFTTHAEASETDYFTAIDTLKTGQDDAGAGLDTEYGADVGHVLPVRGDRHGPTARQSDRLRIGHGGETRAQPGSSDGDRHTCSKRRSTPPLSYADVVMMERGGSQPPRWGTRSWSPLRK